MILQSEVDALNRQRNIKALLIILTTLAVAVVLYVAIKAGREETAVPAPAIVTKQDEEKMPSAEEITKKLNELSQNTDKTSMPSAEEITKKLDELGKNSDGAPKPSQEEILRKLNELSAKK